MRRSTSLLAGAVATIVCSTAVAATPPLPRFSSKVDNPWYPLTPGSVYIYKGAKDGKTSRDVLTVTHAPKVVDGAPCVLVSDRLYLDGVLEERTTEWYSQDDHGNVWYFGEDTAELDRAGKVTSREGSWLAGVSGARAGVFMPARLRVGQRFRQEYLKGHAEDYFQVLDLQADARVPAASSRRALLTKEWTPLEPGVVDHKLYIRGIGLVDERTIRGGDERNALVSWAR